MFIEEEGKRSSAGSPSYYLLFYCYRPQLFATPPGSPPWSSEPAVHYAEAVPGAAVLFLWRASRAAFSQITGLREDCQAAPCFGYPGFIFLPFSAVIWREFLQCCRVRAALAAAAAAGLPAVITRRLVFPSSSPISFFLIFLSFLSAFSFWYIICFIPAMGFRLVHHLGSSALVNIQQSH